MNLNKNLLHINMTCRKLPQLLVLYNAASNSRVSRAKSPRTFYRTLSKGVQLKHTFLPRQVSSCLYSSAVNEEQILLKHPDTFISLPPFVFEDVEFEQPVSHSDLCNALQVCNSVEEQMVALTSTLALSQDDVEKRINFCKKIELLLRPFFGKFKIQMFGSTVNGFGFKGCDIDMSFETFSKERDQISYLETPDVPLVSEVMCGKVTPEEICRLPRTEQLLFIHSVLLEFYKETAEPIIFINAHVPLVRFHHDKYNLKCDLSCCNKVAFANTKLLYLFGRLDDRVIPILMAIRYWAKHVELIGKGLMFNTYTISLLVIHFLQTRNPPILPSAEHILSISDSVEIDDMTDKTFIDIKKSIPPSQNTQTLSELLRDFFFFYLYFDFTRVICPLISGSVSRDKFFSNSPSKKFRMNTICVQDPMLAIHNVAELVDYKTCKKFFKELVIMCKLLQDTSNFSPSSSKWGLLTLLDKPHGYLTNNVTFQKNESFSIPLLNKSIIEKYASDNRNLMTAQTLLYLLRHVLLFECKILGASDIVNLLKKQDELSEQKRKIFESVHQRTSELKEFSRNFRKQVKSPETTVKQALPVKSRQEEFQELNSEHVLIFGAECKVLKNTWLGRDFVPVDSLSNISTYDLIEKEHYVSVQAAKQNELNAMEGKTQHFMFFYECYLPSKESESSLLINFRPFQRTSFNPILGVFLKEYVPKLIEDLNEIC